MKIDRSRVYELLQMVPKGRVTTYKLLAEAVDSRAYRVIGSIVRDNPNPPTIPCHRVVASNGGIGGFMGKTKGLSILKKEKLLQSEGVRCVQGKIENFNKILYIFK